jgi:hypothetical protein
MALQILGFEWSSALEAVFSDTLGDWFLEIEQESELLLDRLKELFVWLDIEFPEPQTNFIFEVQFCNVSGGKCDLTPSATIITKEGIEFSLGVLKPLVSSDKQPPIQIDDKKVIIKGLEIVGRNNEGEICHERFLSMSSFVSESFTLDVIKRGLQHILYLIILDVVNNGAIAQEVI